MRIRAGCELSFEFSSRASNAEARPDTSNQSRATILHGRYGYFLDFLSRRGLLQMDQPAAAYVTPGPTHGGDFPRVAELKDRVGSVTIYGSILQAPPSRPAHCPWPGRQVAG